MYIHSFMSMLMVACSLCFYVLILSVHICRILCLIICLSFFWRINVVITEAFERLYLYSRDCFLNTVSFYITAKWYATFTDELSSKDTAEKNC